MAKKMRVWPYMITSTTLVMAISAPAARTPPAHGSAGALAQRGGERRVAAREGLRRGATPTAAIATST